MSWILLGSIDDTSDNNAELELKLTIEFFSLLLKEAIVFKSLDS